MKAHSDVAPSILGARPAGLALTRTAPNEFSALAVRTVPVEHRFGMNGVSNGSGNRCRRSFRRAREQELRLESDKEAVASLRTQEQGTRVRRGLCPASGGRESAGSVSYPSVKIGLPGSQRNQTRTKSDANKALAEQLRQFYVALTRAKHRCAMIWRQKEKTTNQRPASAHKPRHCRRRSSQRGHCGRTFAGSRQEVWKRTATKQRRC